MRAYSQEGRRRGSRRGLWLFALAATLVTMNAARARAAEAPPSDAELSAAKAEFEEAQTLYVKERFDDAAAKFVSAFEKKPFPAFLFNAAVAFEKAKKLDQAVEFFEKYLKKDPEAKDAKDVAARIENLKKMLAPPPAPNAPPVPGQPAPTAPVTVLPALETKGLVIIETKPQGATLYLDDKKNGVFARTPWQGSLPPTPVKLIVESKGFKPEERDINPRSDKIIEVYIALSEEHFLGWVEIASNVAGADVFIDRKDIGAMGKTPYTGHLKPGKHTVWIERAGYQSSQKDIEVLPGTATNHMIPLDKVDLGWVAIVGKQTKGGKLNVDGVFACNTPCQQEVKPGPHKISVDVEGMEPYHGDVTVEKATQTVVDVHLSPKPPRGRAWTSAVVAAVFLGAGTYMGLQAKKYENDLKKDAANPALLIETDDPRVSKGKIYAIGADVAFGLGTLTGIIAVVNFLSSGADSTADLDQKTISLLPYGTLGGAGFVASGRF